MSYGTLDLGFLTTEGAVANDDGVEIRFKRDNRAVEPQRDLKFGASHKFQLDAFPTVSVWSFDAYLPRYRTRGGGFFTLTNGETVKRRLTVLRKPSAWNARFAKWDALGKDFHPLAALLQRSSAVKLHKTSTPIPAGFEHGDDAKLGLIRASMLNLRGKLVSEKSPVGGRPWFDGIEEILSAGRERLIVRVSETMADEVEQVHASVPDGYKRTNAKNHRKNIPAEFAVERMYSVKTEDRKGNLQLTIARCRDAAGNACSIGDFDIDENGALLAHVADLFKHKITGGTHPFDVHECLRVTLPGVDLGYKLV